MKNFLFFVVACIMVLVFPNRAFSQIQNYDELKRGSVYFNLGYGIQFYHSSSIHIQQDALNNDYKLLNVQGQGTIPSNSGFSPTNISFRVGYYFNYNQDQGVELSYDPCLYFLSDNQNVHISGTRSNVHIDETILFSKAVGNYYYLQKGAGKIQCNFTERLGLYRMESYNFAIDLVVKLGLGAIMPKVDNSIENKNNDASFQLAGFNFGAETGLRIISHRHYCFELLYKYNYAMLSNIKIYEGWASQNISSGMLWFNCGIFLPTTKNNPLFEKGWAHRKRIIHTRPMYLIDTQY